MKCNCEPLTSAFRKQLLLWKQRNTLRYLCLLNISVQHIRSNDFEYVVSEATSWARKHVNLTFSLKYFNIYLMNGPTCWQILSDIHGPQRMNPLDSWSSPDMFCRYCIPADLFPWCSSPCDWFHFQLATSTSCLIQQCLTSDKTTFCIAGFIHSKPADRNVPLFKKFA